MQDYWLRFDPEAEFSEECTEAQIAILDKLGKKVAEWQMTVPAVMFLEQVKPLNYVASQVTLFFEPYLSLLFKGKDFIEFRRAIAKREGISLLIDKIEEHEIEYSQKRSALKTERKKHGFWAKWIGRRKLDEKS
ncbi:hypothetical protein JW877_00735 [bacterium]|nr:hypothetical protein [bacterium]